MLHYDETAHCMNLPSGQEIEARPKEIMNFILLILELKKAATYSSRVFTNYTITKQA